MIGEICLVPYSMVPRGFVPCDGRELQMTQYPSLYSLLGTTYGGDGRTTFAVPDLRGRVPLQAGTEQAGPLLGKSGGQAYVALSAEHLPEHNHPVDCSSRTADSNSSGSAVLAVSDPAHNGYVADSQLSATMPTEPVGENRAHNNMQPFLAMQFVIATTGDFPEKPSPEGDGSA